MLDLDHATVGSFGAITSGAAGVGTIAFASTGNAETLQVESLALSGDHSLAYSITGFTVGGDDVIDVRGVGTDQVSYSSSNGTLTLTSGGATKAILHIGASYGGDTFTAVTDGAGGAQVTAAVTVGLRLPRRPLPLRRRPQIKARLEMMR